MRDEPILPPLYQNCWYDRDLWRDGYAVAIAEELALRATAPVDIAVVRLGSALQQAEHPVLRVRLVDTLRQLTMAQICIAARLTARVLPHLTERLDTPEDALQEALAASGLTTLAAVEQLVAEELGEDLMAEVHLLLEETRRQR
jgi:hypothetical protein